MTIDPEKAAWEAAKQDKLGKRRKTHGSTMQQRKNEGRPQILNPIISIQRYKEHIL